LAWSKIASFEFFSNSATGPHFFQCASSFEGEEKRFKLEYKHM
jgi:hypothetical protein